MERVIYNIVENWVFNEFEFKVEVSMIRNEIYYQDSICYIPQRFREKHVKSTRKIINLGPAQWRKQQWGAFEAGK